LDISSDQSVCEALAVESIVLHWNNSIMLHWKEILSRKTTLATKIAEDFNAKTVLERFADNPFTKVL
jgi:hypothetical protein